MMNIAILSFAHMHAESYAQALLAQENVTLSGIWDDDVARGKDAAHRYGTTFYADLTALLQTDIDAVIVCSENYRHKALVIEAAKHHKHILCEKPIATEVEDAKAMIKACEAHQVTLQIAYPVRFIPAIEAAVSYIKAGGIGDVIAINAANHGQLPGGWFIDKEKAGGGAATDHIVHIMDVVRWMLDDEVSGVYARLATLFHNIDVEDSGQVVIEMEKGTLLNLDPSWSRPRTFPMWGDVLMEVIGTEGTLKIDGFKDTTTFYDDQAKQVTALSWGIDMDERLVQDFVSCINEGRKPFITGEDGLRTLKVVKAAYQSNETNQFVKVTR
ncbi:dehydrogenase [Halolactibacillus miurensis]|uniref:Dehydrogenase n=2 Tax=Halolactibacillus TaxID=306539 RepID=A0A1I6P1W8_9BACI|nr:Gfo/Idh/MocA family oxidoreductase [Halolactibacillus miurensis]GEM03184.1 dehydrogenase [Halolactibacillus miurensis]SFS34068.1 Predicted dehydrogenase [Halolactibacillus miurensis]